MPVQGDSSRGLGLAGTCQRVCSAGVQKQDCFDLSTIVTWEAMDTCRPCRVTAAGGLALLALARPDSLLNRHAEAGSLFS